MAKRPTPDVMGLTVRERILLFCVGSGTDWQRCGAPYRPSSEGPRMVVGAALAPGRELILGWDLLVKTL